MVAIGVLKTVQCQVPGKLIPSSFQLALVADAAQHGAYAFWGTALCSCDEDRRCGDHRCRVAELGEEIAARMGGGRFVYV
jgi:hypothetical protein